MTNPCIICNTHYDDKKYSISTKMQPIYKEILDSGNYKLNDYQGNLIDVSKNTTAYYALCNNSDCVRIMAFCRTQWNNIYTNRTYNSKLPASLHNN